MLASFYYLHSFSGGSERSAIDLQSVESFLWLFVPIRAQAIFSPQLLPSTMVINTFYHIMLHIYGAIWMLAWFIISSITIAFISSTQALSISEHVCIDLSDCPSVWGWNAVLKLTLLPNTFCKLYKNWDKNLESLSDTMLTGMEHHVALQSL